MIWKYTFPLHNKLKTSLLTSIQYSVGKGYDADEFDRITKTDYYEHLDLDQKTYLRLLHSNLTDFYDVMSQKYCLLDFSLYNGWYQQYYNLDTHHWHTHSRSNVSMVYYLELDGPEHSTEFWCPETRKKFQLDAKEGDIVVFPAYQAHRSPPIQSDNRKTIISCNYNFESVRFDCINGK